MVAAAIEIHLYHIDRRQREEHFLWTALQIFMAMIGDEILENFSSSSNPNETERCATSKFRRWLRIIHTVSRKIHHWVTSAILGRYSVFFFSALLCGSTFLNLLSSTQTALARLEYSSSIPNIIDIVKLIYCEILQSIFDTVKFA